MAVKWGQLHFQLLEICKTENLKKMGSYDALASLFTEAISELRCWCENVANNCTTKISNIIRNIANFEYKGFTDASFEGWGAFFVYKEKTI